MQSPRSRDDLPGHQQQEDSPGPQVSRVSAVHKLWEASSTTGSARLATKTGAVTCETSPVTPSLLHPHLWHRICASSPVHPHLWHLTCAPSPVTPSPVYLHLCDLTCDTFTCASSPMQLHLWHHCHLWHHSHLWHSHLSIVTCATSPVTSLSPVTPSPVYPHLCILTCETSLVQLHLWHPSHLWQPHLYILTCSSWQSTLQSTLTPRQLAPALRPGCSQKPPGLGMNRCWFQQALKNRLVSVPSHSPPSYLEIHLASHLSNSPISQRRETTAATSPGYSLPPKSSEKPAPWTPPLLLLIGEASVSEP